VAAGRANPLRLADPLVSRLHARVSCATGRSTLIDTGSANGTFVLPPGESMWQRSMPRKGPR